MYSVFINTHTLSASAETLKNIQPERSLEPGVDLISLLPSGMKHGRGGGVLIITVQLYYCKAAMQLCQPKKWLKG